MSPHLPDVDLFNALATVGAASALIWAWVTKIGPACKSAWSFLRRAFHMVDEIAGVAGDPRRPSAMAKLDAVHAQVFPNGGSSLRDVVNKQAEQWEITSAQLVTIAATQEQFAQGLESNVLVQEQRTVQVAQIITRLDDMSGSFAEHLASHIAPSEKPVPAKRAVRVPKQRPA